MDMILVVHAVATLFLTGLIWFVQVVHYPLFERVGRDAFTEYERLHAEWTSRVVAPAMLAEGICAVAIVVKGMAPEPDRGWAMVGLGLLAVIWLSTFALQVPRHRRLAAGFDAATARSLVQTNWIRTVAWTARCWVALRLLGLA
ncbi:MAG TPA: hypothetical protein VKU85_16360 [bacterium]|nr:hypothetical protein [bacterium]